MNIQLSRSESADLGSDALLSELLRPFSDNSPFDAAELVSENSQLKQMPSLMVDLAYEDYWRKCQSGCEVDTAEFAGKFPEIQDRLLHMISVGDLIKQEPEVFLSLLQPNWPAVPSELGPFSLVHQIGTGSFSRVYLARDLSLAGRPVTLKVTRHAVREAEALGRLQHPNIVCPLGMYDQLIPGLQVIAMPFCGRATLADLIHFSARHSTTEECDELDLNEFLSVANASLGHIAETSDIVPKLPFSQVLASVGANVAEGLAYAHDKGFLHCDIKPSNILLRQNGAPLILDFNLSVDTHRNSCTGGTLSYIAPEQLHSLGHSTALNGAIDVYALGATLIEFAQGTPPFGKLGSHSTRKEDFEHPLEKFGERFQFNDRHRQKLGNSLAELLESCVALDPAARPTANELAIQLRRHAQVETNPERSRKRPVILAACVSGALLLTAGTAWSISSTPTLEQRYNLGVAALASGDSGRTASRHFSQVLEAEPNRLDAKILRVCALIQEKDWNFASIELRELINLNSDPELRALLGYVLSKWTRQHEIAEHEYKMYFANGAPRLDVLNNLAHCQIRLNKLDEALASLELAKQFAPDCPTILFNEACIELKLARELKVPPRVHFAQAILSHPELNNDREALLIAAGIYWLATPSNLGLSEKAFECLTRAVPQGLTIGDLKRFPNSQTLMTAPQYKQVAMQAARNRQVKGNEEGVARLISPPLHEPGYVTQLVNSISTGTVPVASTVVGHGQLSASIRLDQDLESEGY